MTNLEIINWVSKQKARGYVLVVPDDIDNFEDLKQQIIQKTKVLSVMKAKDAKRYSWYNFGETLVMP